MKALFGDVKKVVLPGVTEEEGFITATLKEKDFDRKYAELADVQVGARLRLEA